MGRIKEYKTDLMPPDCGSNINPGGKRKVLKDQIKSLRLGLGISQSELARRAGYSHEFISQVERGVKSPSIKALQKIAWGLGVSPSLLMESKNSPMESEERLKHDIQKMINRLPLNRLKVIRDLLMVIPNQEDAYFGGDKLTVIK